MLDLYVKCMRVFTCTHRMCVPIWESQKCLPQLHLLRQILLLHPGLADFASLGSQLAPRISCLSFQSLLGFLAQLPNESGALSTKPFSHSCGFPLFTHGDVKHCSLGRRWQ